MADPYRAPEHASDPRYEAETRLINAKASLFEEVRRGLSIANALAASGNSHNDYATRIEALRRLGDDLHRWERR